MEILTYPDTIFIECMTVALAVKKMWMLVLVPTAAPPSGYRLVIEAQVIIRRNQIDAT